jgi:hypothetical protein
MNGARIRPLHTAPVTRRCSERHVARALLSRVHLPALASVLLAGVLVFVGVVRLLSYYRATVGHWVGDSILGFLAYQPDSFFNVRYFKILASLSAGSFIYFLFRILNRGHRRVFPPGYPSHHKNLGFGSPWLRLVLITAIDLHWAAQEWYKFSTKSYPYSPLESWESNAVVLAVSSLIAFFGMKYLSFGPLLKGSATGVRLDRITLPGIKSETDI